MNPTEFAGLSEIGQIALSMRDVARATVFYRDVLGLKFLFSAPPGLAFFAAGSVRLMLSAGENAGEKSSANSTLYFKVGDIHAVQRELTARGGSFERQPHCIAKLPDHDLWMTFLRDPEGNLIGLMSEVRQ